MTESKKKPPPWASADGWPDWPDEARACHLNFLRGYEYARHGKELPSYPLPPQVGDLIVYDHQYWQFGVVTSVDLGRGSMLIKRYGNGLVAPSEDWKYIANAVKVVGRRGVERRRAT